MLCLQNRVNLLLFNVVLDAIAREAAGIE